MTLLRAPLRVGRFALTLRGTADLLFEVLVIGGTVAFLELIGTHSPNDGVDLLGLTTAASLGLLLSRRARAGRMPLTRLLVRPSVAWLRRRLRELTPRHAVGFRPGAVQDAREDPALRTLGRVLFVGALVTPLAGPWVFRGLSFLKAEVSYTLYLLLLAVLWATLSATIIFGTYAIAQWVQERRAPRSERRVWVSMLLSSVWVASLVLAANVPGVVPLLLLVGIGLYHAWQLRTPLVQGYFFCRRDAKGRPLGIAVEAFALRTYVVLVMAVALTVALGQGERLVSGAWPQGTFGFTAWLSVLASLCGLVLVHRTGVQVQRLLGSDGNVPELPLIPTAWLPDARFSGGERWQQVARDHGWYLAEGPVPPKGGFDLVTGAGAHPRRLHPPQDDTSDAEIDFQLQRRLHITMRRAFHRRLQKLFKRLKAEADEATGSGYLFCPHVWLVPGVVRDGEIPSSRGPFHGPVLHGPPYAQAFSLRIRRYVGGILRAAQIDILFWEDAIQWADLRRVLGILYEQVDQRRVPVEERHFMGLPRLRVVIQEEDAEPQPPAQGVLPAAGKARILLVLRDRGHGEDAHTRDPADSQRTPSLIC